MTVEHPSTASSEPQTTDHSAEDEVQAEHGLARAIIICVLVAVPISVAFWVGLVAFAVNRSGSPLGGPIAMAVAVGVLSGLFLGTWAAFVSKTHLFEEMDRNVDSGGGSAGAEARHSSGRSSNR